MRQGEEVTGAMIFADGCNNGADSATVRKG